MLVSNPQRWPRFGAAATYLRYDDPISVRNEGGTFSTLDHAKGWDPRLQDIVISLPGETRHGRNALCVLARELLRALLGGAIQHRPQLRIDDDQPAR